LNTPADLDLSGEIVYAINFGNNGNPRFGSFVFSQDQDYPQLTFTTSAEGETSTWQGIPPNTGYSDLDMLLHGVTWLYADPSSTTSINAGGLVAGMQYQLQLIFYTDQPRPMDIVVEGDTILAGHDTYVAQGSVQGKGGSILKYSFRAGDATLNISLTAHGLASVISGLVLARTWPPSPEFNGDCRIDIEDLVMLIEHWGQNESSFDVAPPPAGDSIIDRQDLEVLMSHWGEELPDPTFVAHWPLDETEGNTAHDSAGANDALVMGNAIWQPNGGKIGGALALDGIDDFIPTSFVLDPGKGPFSVFAWIKGGGPGQVVISQQGGVNWLCTNPADGTVMTNLMDSGRLAKRGLSNAVVTDDQWHRIGLVWDGANRFLYVDDKEVAKDAQPGLVGRGGALTIGAGYALAPGSLWSGLIDDVRIYNRAVKP